MKRRNPSLAKLLLLLGVLIIGPLQAQDVFACAMMDEVLQECCCIGQKTGEDGFNPTHDQAVDDFNDLCCERSVTISFDGETGQEAPVIKPVEVRSDVDPPADMMVSITEFDVQPQRRSLSTEFSLPDRCQSRSDTYLLTQRLRI